MEQNYTKKNARGRIDNIAAAAAEVGHTPPQAPDIEEAVLGGMLIDNDCIADSMESLTAKCFYDPRNRMIFQAISELNNERQPVDMLTVSERLKRDGHFDESGGAMRLAQLTEHVGSGAHIDYHVKILLQKCIQRDLIEASYGILRDAFNETTDVDALIESSQTSVYNAVQGNLRSEYKQIGDIVNRSMERIQSVQNSHGITGVPSGFPSLDSITMGWQKSNLVIIGARPSMGKTAFALNTARNAAVNFNIPVAFFSLEMADIELSDRLIASESGITSDKLRGRFHMDNADWVQLEGALTKLVKAPLYIDETPGLTITEFRSKVKRLVREKNIQVVFVDYLQLMHGNAAQQQSYREQEVSAISQALKATAKEHKITVIALAQLNRNLMTRTGSNGRPTLSDLRDSGSIEQDADLVLFVHRPGMIGFDEDLTRTEIIIAKHRNGRTDSINMQYHGETFQFSEESDSLVAYASKMNDDLKGSRPKQDRSQWMPDMTMPPSYDPFEPNRDF